MRPVVQFDVDGVLADFMTAFTSRAQALGLCDRVTGTAEQQIWESYGTVDPKHVDTVWRDIKASRDFWEYVPPLVSAGVFHWIDELQGSADVFFATARVGATAKEQTARWLIGQGVSQPTVVVTPNKGDTAVALRVTHAIDDKAGNAIYTGYVLKKKGKSYVIDRAYNRFNHQVVGGGVIRVASVVDFLHEIEGEAA